MKLNDIVPWGRSLDEYVEMFSLTEQDLSKNILGCGDGPASFNAELTAKGGQVRSIDPIYMFSTEQIRSRIKGVYNEVLSQVKENKDKFIWTTIADIESLASLRMTAMYAFLADYQVEGSGGRYIEGALPNLPFEDKHFELALCSHFLFLYSEHFDLQQHLLSVEELCRVAKEVRIYPLLSLSGEVSPYLEKLSALLKEQGKSIHLQTVSYEFQKGATQMMVIV